MRFLAVIPARGGSKGIPRKNLARVAGRPLIAWSIAAARAAHCIERVVVSTEDAEIAAVARNEGADIVDRPAELAADDTPTRPVIVHAFDAAAASGFAADAVFTLQPTSPLRTARHIDDAAALFAADPFADSLVSCIAVPHIFHPRSVMRMSPEGYLQPYLDAPLPLRRQDKEPVFARNGAAIYITRADRLSEFIFGGRLLRFEMTPADSLDIDTPDDLDRADAALSAQLAAKTDA